LLADTLRHLGAPRRQIEQLVAYSTRGSKPTQDQEGL